MKDKDEKLEMKEQGPVWKAKIGLRSGISENRLEVFRKSKKWKMNIILN